MSLARNRTLHCFDSHTSGQVYHLCPLIASTLSATVTATTLAESNHTTFVNALLTRESTILGIIVNPVKNNIPVRLFSA